MRARLVARRGVDRRDAVAVPFFRRQFGKKASGVENAIRRAESTSRILQTVRPSHERLSGGDEPVSAPSRLPQAAGCTSLPY